MNNIQSIARRVFDLIFLVHFTSRQKEQMAKKVEDADVLCSKFLLALCPMLGIQCQIVKKIQVPTVGIFNY